MYGKIKTRAQSDGLRFVSFFYCLLFLLTFSLPSAAMPADSLKWYERVQQLEEIMVRSDKKKYSRKADPAVELMRKVIAARRDTRLSAHDYYHYCKYRKLTMAVNDISHDDFEKGMFAGIPGFFRQVELCPHNNKLILPVVVTEAYTQETFRKDPRDSKTIVRGYRSEGINKVFRSGELITAALADFFPDIDIYDNRIRLLQQSFTSPIGDDALRFYRFTIVDTLSVGADRCVRLRFMPDNILDFGFCGDIYVMDDSSYRVRRCELSVPKRGGVNFVDGLRILQEFGAAPGGEWVMTLDEMVGEFKMFDFLKKCIVIRTTHMGGHYFAALPDKLFRGFDKEMVERGADRRDDSFWDMYRPVDLTPGERNLPEFMRNVKMMGRNNILLTALRSIVENYVEVGAGGREALVDIGPVNAIISNNSVDGLRTRIGGKTTANLNRHLFFNGYYAHGWKSRADYYKAELTYSFRPKIYTPEERPKRSITLTSVYDICFPGDRGVADSEHNMFTALTWGDTERMMTYNRQRLTFEREETWGLTSSLMITAEENMPRGKLMFTAATQSIRTAELRAGLRFAPGERFVATKRGRRRINRDVPVLTLTHAVGIDGCLGGGYDYNITELMFSNRFWMKSWGKVDVRLHASAQWNSVPFPLLVIPSANQSYMLRDGMFNLMDNMEFLSDRCLSADITWDIGGKIFNRVPFVRDLRWRECLGVKAMWSSLTSKNNPYEAGCGTDGVLMPFPDDVHVMSGSTPYVEIMAGVHNVFRFFDIEYVRRLTYLGHPTAKRQGVRFRFKLQF